MLHGKLHQLTRVHCIPLKDSVEETAVELISFNKLRDVEELEYAAALESGISYYERVDRLYGVMMARREDVLRQLDLYRQGLGHRLRQVSDAIIDGEFSETEQESPSIAGSGDGGQ